MTNPNPNPNPDEAREIMRKYYEGLMAPVEQEHDHHNRYTTRPRYSEAELNSPEYREINRARQMAGLPPISNRAGRRQPVGISLTENEAEALRSLAAEWGYMHGGRGNLSAFLAAIALGNLVISPQYEN